MKCLRLVNVKLLVVVIFTSLILTSCGVLSQTIDRSTKLPVPPCPDPTVDVTWYGPFPVKFTDGGSRVLYALDVEDKRVLDIWIKAWLTCSAKREQVIKVLNGD